MVANANPVFLDSPTAPARRADCRRPARAAAIGPARAESLIGNVPLVPSSRRCRPRTTGTAGAEASVAAPDAPPAAAAASRRPGPADPRPRADHDEEGRMDRTRPTPAARAAVSPSRRWSCCRDRRGVPRATDRHPGRARGRTAARRRRATTLDGRDDLRRARRHRRRERHRARRQRRRASTSPPRPKNASASPDRARAARHRRRRQDRSRRRDARAGGRRDSGRSLGLTGEQVKLHHRRQLAEDPESDFAYLAKAVKLDVFKQVKALDIPWVYSETASERVATRTAPSPATSSASSAPTAPQAGIELDRGRVPRGDQRDVAATRRAADGVQHPRQRGHPEAAARRRHVLP